MLVVHCGRLSKEKHVDPSIDAVAVLSEAGVRARLGIAGDGPLRSALERRARRLPVTFLGFVARRGEPSVRARAARARAEQYDWPTSVEQMLAAMPR